MKRVLIAGSSGMIGGLVLKNCLDRDDVAEVTSIVRKVSGIKHPKLTEVVHDDFLNFGSIEKYFNNQDVCFYCIGVYTGQVPKAVFTRITVDFTKAFAVMLKRCSPGSVFCFLSGSGADSKERSMILFARDKGKAENFLLGLAFRSTFIFRPGYIYPVTPRREPNFSYRVFRVLYKYILAFVFPSVGVTSVQLAEVMTSVGFNGGEKIIYENEDIRKFKSR